MPLFSRSSLQLYYDGMISLLLRVCIVVKVLYLEDGIGNIKRFFVYYELPSSNQNCRDVVRPLPALGFEACGGAGLLPFEDAASEGEVSVVALVPPK